MPPTRKTPRAELVWKGSSYVLYPLEEERGRVTELVGQLGACVWGPKAGSEATESATFASNLLADAKAWVEQRVKALDKHEPTTAP